MAENSFEKINYYLRPNKQVERKILLDILLRFREFINLDNFTYIGMGSIYYYDYILLHRLLGLTKLISFDSAKSVKRLKFNKPYDFIEFVPSKSTDFLLTYNWKENNTITWLDYDGSFYDNIESIINDIKLLAQNCNNHDIVFLTINCFPPKKIEAKRDLLETYKRYISLDYQNNEWLKPENFHYLIQNIMNNIFVSENAYSLNKYNKICSFLYRDGAPMYTLGGFFTSDTAILDSIKNMHKYISFDTRNIHNILIPQITYKEKHYLDNHILQIKEWVEEYSQLVQLDEPDKLLHDEKLEKYLNEEMEFELTTTQINNYLEHYRFMPQYFEGLI